MLRQTSRDDERKLVHVLGRSAGTEPPAKARREVEIRSESHAITFHLSGREVNRLEGDRTMLCYTGFSA